MAAKKVTPDASVSPDDPTADLNQPSPPDPAVAPTVAPASAPEPVDYSFVDLVGQLLDHLAGQPMDGHLQPYYTAVRNAHNDLLGIPPFVPDRGEPTVPMGKTAEEQRAAATQVKHGSD